MLPQRALPERVLPERVLPQRALPERVLPQRVLPEHVLKSCEKTLFLTQMALHSIIEGDLLTQVQTHAMETLAH